MGYTPNQRPWSLLNSNWQGRFDVVADLPNTAGSLLQPGVPNVQNGDLAWVTGGTPGLYVCTDPTLGAAVWELVTTGGGGSGIVGPENVVYLEMPAPNGRGDDATGARGNAALPFATWAAAWGAMQSGDQMRIAGGTFGAFGPVTTPNSWSVVGAGRNATRIAGSVNILDMPSSTIGFMLVGVSMDTSGGAGGRCLRVNGAGGGGATLNDSGFIFDCNLRSDSGVNAIEANFCGAIQIRDTRIRDGKLDLNTASVLTWNVLMEGNSSEIVQRWAASADTPSRRLSEHHGLSAPNTNLILEGAPQVTVFSDSQINDVPNSGVLTLVDGLGAFRFWGRGANLELKLPDTVTDLLLDLTESIWSGVVDFEVVNPAANRQTVTARGMMMLGTAAARIIARAGVDIFAFGDANNSDILSTPGGVGFGTITPSRWTSNGPVTLTGATAVSYGFVAGSVPRFAVASPAVPATGAIGVAPAVNEVVCTPAANGDAYIEVRWA